MEVVLQAGRAQQGTGVKRIGNCEICGINMLRKVPNQRFCGMHTMSLRSTTGEGRLRKIAELKRKYKDNPRKGWEDE